MMTLAVDERRGNAAAELRIGLATLHRKLKAHRVAPQAPLTTGSRYRPATAAPLPSPRERPGRSTLAVLSPRCTTSCVATSTEITMPARMRKYHLQARVARPTGCRILRQSVVGFSVTSAPELVEHGPPSARDLLRRRAGRARTGVAPFSLWLREEVRPVVVTRASGRGVRAERSPS